jgi:hypothetical protein
MVIVVCFILKVLRPVRVTNTCNLPESRLRSPSQRDWNFLEFLAAS